MKFPHKSVQWEPSSSMPMDGQTNGQTDTVMMNLIVAFHSFVNAPKKENLADRPRWFCYEYTAAVIFVLLGGRGPNKI